MHPRGVRYAEQLVQPFHDIGMQCGRHRTDPQRPGRQHEVLHGRDDRQRIKFTGCPTVAVRDDDRRHTGHVVSEPCSATRHFVGRGDVVDRLPTGRVAALRPPRFAVQGADVLNHRSIGQQQEPGGLEVATARCLDRSFEDESQDLDRHGIGLQPADRTLAEERVAQCDCVERCVVDRRRCGVHGGEHRTRLGACSGLRASGNRGVAPGGDRRVELRADPCRWRNVQSMYVCMCTYYVLRVSRPVAIDTPTATSHASPTVNPIRWNSPCDGPASVAARHRAERAPAAREADAAPTAPCRDSGAAASSGTAVIDT